ncbi:MAG: hypothetical protein GWP63_23645 [Haliea sp.]|nr:hypothetical protein [Haliea sp.]
MTVAVHRADHAPLAGVSVTGSWSNGANGSSTCTTAGDGICTLSKGGIKGNAASATFSVTNLSGDALTYDPADNDLAPVAITVSRP